MAIISAAITVTASPTEIAPVDPTRRRLLLHNGGGGTVYLGGPTVTAGNGHHIGAQESLVLVQSTDSDTTTKQAFYAIVSTGTATLTVTEISD